jgi:hypothetical protein
VAGLSLGSVLGAWLSERWLVTTGSERVLEVCAGGAIVSLGAVMLAPSVAWLSLAILLLGACAAPQYALLKARAYAESPGRPGVVNALSQVFVIIDVLGPLALGAVADALGVVAALGCLAVQPCAVLVVLRISGARRGAKAR